ncbi:hypothetical protein KY284_033191 [Solanum tuberosum]|nr:hypothetical protein KY284_033191 [Solanum tuberosum]
MIGTASDQRKTLTSGKVVRNKQNRQEWMVRRRNKYKRDKYGCIEGKVDYQDENIFEALREDQDKDTMENMTDNKEGKSTKEWVENTFEHKKKEDMLKVHEILNEGKRDNTKTKQCDTEDVQNTQGEKEAMIEQNEGAKYETDKEGALAIAKINEEEVIPLAMQMDNDEGGMDQNMNDIEKEDLSQNIRQLAIEGDLSPKQIRKLNDTHTKQMKHNEEEITKAQASSSQSKRTIVKNSKYQ